MLIGTTVTGLQKLLRLMRIAEKRREMEERRNKNIYESLTASNANKPREYEKSSYIKNIINSEAKFHEEKEANLSWIIHENIQLANSNNAKIADIAEHESFAARMEEQKHAAQKAVGL